eukprot:6462989-Amphidinium_carterae.1
MFLNLEIESDPDQRLLAEGPMTTEYFMRRSHEEDGTDWVLVVVVTFHYGRIWAYFPNYSIVGSSNHTLQNGLYRVHVHVYAEARAEDISSKLSAAIEQSVDGASIGDIPTLVFGYIVRHAAWVKSKVCNAIGQE